MPRRGSGWSGEGPTVREVPFHYVNAPPLVRLTLFATRPNLWCMGQKLIAVYGGTELDAATASFVSRLVELLLGHPDVVIVTGGFDYSADLPKAKSTDRAAHSGAVKFTQKAGVALAERFQTWIPEHGRDRKGVERFKEGLVRELKGKSAQARRLTLVEQVDAVVTIKGKKHTALVLDMALAVDKPALPIALTGGDSETYWKDNKEQIVHAFQLSNDLAQRLETVSLGNPDQVERLAWDLAASIWNASSHVCLILSAFRKEDDAFQEAVLNPVVEAAGFKPVRLDQTPDTGNIASIFLSRLRSSDAVIADITEGSLNVLYELGHAHARGIEPLLLARRKPGDEVWKELPFYLYQEKRVAFDANTEEGRSMLESRVRQFLQNIRTTGTNAWSGAGGQGA